MKNTLIRRVTKYHVLALSLCYLFVSLYSHAGLINRGNGLIYDDVLDITWMQNADYLRTSGFQADGYVTKATANGWVDNLVYQGFDDWRLPNQVSLNDTGFGIGFSFDGSTDRGFNQSGTHNELNYMFYTNLANTSFWSSDGNPNQAGSETFNSSFLDAETGELFNFQNISISYWSNPENIPINNASWGFNFQGINNVARGEVQLLNIMSELSVWAVRDGDVGVQSVTVSSPSALSLLFFGVAGALAIRRQNN
jgi:hypothetical protein